MAQGPRELPPNAAMEPARGGPLVGWLGQRISGALSLDGALYAVDRYYDLALDPERAADPSGPFRALLSRPSPGLARFAPPARERLTALLGHYHAAQGLDSPEALLWNAFAPFSRPRLSRRWLNEVLSAAFGEADYPDGWEAQLWRAGAGAGAAAAEVVAPGGWRFAVAAQWQSDLGTGAPDALASAAAALPVSESSRSGLLVIVPSPARYPPARDPGSLFRRYFLPAADGYVPAERARALPARARAVTWESLGERADAHPHGAELRAYIGWRASLLAGPPAARPGISGA